MMRAAIYWAPGAGDPLRELGNAWLGRDPRHGAPAAQPDVPGIADFTSTARLYGFHCTLRAPMRPAAGLDAFCVTAARVARATRPFALPALEVQDFGGFLALGLAAPCLEVAALAERCVRETDRHRTVLSDAELARRRASGLTRRQDALLQRWGYPYVLEEWFFHCTLTGRLNETERTRVAPAIVRHFGTALQAPRMVEEICVFAQNGGDFLIAERFPLG